jgi:hypothetical protein
MEMIRNVEDVEMKALGVGGTERIGCDETVMSISLPQRVPENSPGDFYVRANLCTQCCLVHGAAPELLNDLKESFKECFFRRQPQTPEEVDRALSAIAVSEMCALRYGGTDPEILAKMRGKGLASQADQTPEGQALIRGGVPVFRSRRLPWWKRFLGINR